MAKSDVAQALYRLQGLAENFIALETDRRIQLGREKEARMVEAYQYMLTNEEEEIGELESALESIKLNLNDRGIEHLNLKDEQKTMNFEVILNAAAEGSTELISAKVDDAKLRRDNLQEKKVQATAIQRQIDLYDNALTLLDPAFHGEKHIVDAEDVVEALKAVEEGSDEFIEIFEQYQEFYTRPEQLEGLQADYYAKLARESKEKIAASTAQTTDSSIKIKLLEGDCGRC